MSVNRFPRLIIGNSLVTSGKTSALTSGKIGLFASTTHISGSPSANNAFDYSSVNKDVNFYVAQYSGSSTTGTIKSYPMDVHGGLIKKIYKKTYVAKSNQMTYMGWDGSSATGLSYDCEKEYSIGIRIESPEVNRYFNEPGLIRTVGIVTPCCDTCTAGCTTVTCGTQTALLVGLINAETFINQYVSAVMVQSGTFSASSGGTLALVQGSKTVTIVESSGGAADAGKYNSDSSTMVVGDFIRIGGTADDYPVYRIDAITGAGTDTCTITLNTPYQAASNSALAAASAGIMTAVTACGIQFTGKYIDRSNGCCCEPKFLRAIPVTFKVFPMKGWECTQDVNKDGTFNGLITYSNSASNNPATAAVFGHGTGAEVQELENELLGYSFKREFLGWDCRWDKDITRFTDTTKNYDLYYIMFDHPYETQTIVGAAAEHMYTIIALETGTGTAIEADLAMVGVKAGIFPSGTTTLPSGTY